MFCYVINQKITASCTISFSSTAMSKLLKSDTKNMTKILSAENIGKTNLRLKRSD